MTSALVEGGFINNPNEATKLADDDYQDKLATGIADGIEKYLKENIELVPNVDQPIVPEEPQQPEVPEVIQPPTAPPTIIEPPVEVKTGVVTATSLNVRSGYGTSYSKIGSLSKGSKVEIVESKNGWYKIKYNNGYGYVSSEFVK